MRGGRSAWSKLHGCQPVQCLSAVSSLPSRTTPVSSFEERAIETPAIRSQRYEKSTAHGSWPRESLSPITLADENASRGLG
jgi:hypothetical protein